MVIETDPWRAQNSPERYMSAFLLSTNSQYMPRSLVFEELKRAECLIGRTKDDTINLVIVLQFTREIWAVYFDP